MTDIHSLPFDAHVSHPKLGKASLLRLEFHWWWFKREYRGGRFVLRNRGANFYAIYLGPVHACWRRPWLAGPARRLHPELFAKAGEPKCVVEKV